MRLKFREKGIYNLLSLRKFFYAITIFFLFPALVSAQTAISGIVKDTETNEPVIGGTIVIKELQKGTTTNADGKYEISIPFGSYTVVVSSIGYETKEQTLNCKKKEIEFNIELKESVIQINEVKVTVKTEARLLREQAMPVAVITMNEMQGTVSDVSDVLSKTSGVKIRSSGATGSASRISVRGLEGKRIGFYVDDIPIGDNSEFISINDIPIDMIDRVEIYKGIVPAKLGASSMGGAVNIVTKEYPPMYMDVNYTIQSFNTHKFNGVLKRNKNGIELGIGGFYTYADNDYEMELPLRRGVIVTRDHDQFKKLVIAGGITSKNWWFDEVGFEPSFISSYKEIQGIESYNVKQAETSSKAFVLSNNLEKTDFLLEGLDLDIKNNYGYTVYRYIDSASVRYGWEGETTSVYLDDYGVGQGEIGAQPNDVYNQKHSFFQKMNLNYVIDKCNSVNFNSQYKLVRGNPSDTLCEKVIGYQTNYKSRMNSWVTGLSYEYNSLDKKLSNALNIKSYYYSMETKIANMDGTTAIPEDIDMKKHNFGINDAFRYRITPSFLAKTSLAYDVRLPSDEELLGDGFLILPAGDLEPERNTSANLGFMFDNANTHNNNIQVEANVFYMYIENMIRMAYGLMQSNYENFGEMRTLGAEIEVKWNAANWLYLWGNATYQDLRDTRKYDPGTTVKNATKGDRIPNIPYLFANAGFEMHKQNLFGGKGQNTRFFSDCSYVEEYYYDFEQSLDETRKIPQSITVNAGLEHSLKNQTLFISLQANNILDATVISEYNRPLPGRNFGMKLRYVMK